MNCRTRSYQSHARALRMDTGAMSLLKRPEVPPQAQGMMIDLRGRTSCRKVSRSHFYKMNQIFAQKCLESVRENSISTHEGFNMVKKNVAKELKTLVPRNSDILEAYRQLVKKEQMPEDEQFVKMLKVREIRTLSGIAAIGVHSKPFPCPGKCIYCPTEPNMPKSYLSNQPAVMRSTANDFDPYRMVQSRLEMLKRNGHHPDKCELIVMGGTWSFFPWDYQQEFLQRSYDGFNGVPSKNLEEAKKQNETATHRVIGVTLETRPDYVTEDEVRRWRVLGATRAEMGVQHLDREILDANRRGHYAEDSAHATQLFKDAGFKITYHMMPGLFKATPEKDIAMFQELFENPSYQPDQIKVYPTIVNRWTILHQLWKRGEFEPYTTETLLAMIPQIKKYVPPYVRIPRLFRDIPGQSIQAGSRVTNLRQVALQEMAKRGERCACIRCREPRANKMVTLDELELVAREYNASGGKEIFLSYESHDRRTLYALLRLRFPSQLFTGVKHFLPVLHNAALIREVHTYGELISPGSHDTHVQHRGLGKRLMEEAEQRAKAFGVKRMAVIAGVGVREYYRKLGYTLEEEYMVKDFG